MRLHHRVHAGQGGKGVVGLHIRQSGAARQFGCHSLAKALGRIQPGAHCRATHCQRLQTQQGSPHLDGRLAQLRHPAGDLLPHRQGRGILQMGTPDLDDVRKGIALGFECAGQPVQRRQQQLLQGTGQRHMHGRGKDVVAGLVAIDMVIRVYRLPLQQLPGPVRQHLVHVHVALGAGAGLPDRQRKLVGPLAIHDLLRRLRHGLRHFGRQLAQRAIHARTGLLDPRQRLHEGRRAAFGGYGKKVQRALRLRAPQAIGRYLHRPQAVVFQTVFHDHPLPCCGQARLP